MGVTGTLHPAVLSHSIQIDAYVDGLLDGLEVASPDLLGRCSRGRHGRRPRDGVRWLPVGRRVRGRRVIVYTPGASLRREPRGVACLGLGCMLVATGVRVLDRILLGSWRMSGLRRTPGACRGRSSPIGIDLVVRSVHLGGGGQGPVLALRGGVDDPHVLVGGVDRWECSSGSASLTAPKGSLNAASGVVEPCTWGATTVSILFPISGGVKKKYRVGGRSGPARCARPDTGTRPRGTSG